MPRSSERDKLMALIEREYIHGVVESTGETVWFSLREMSVRHNVPARTLEYESSKHDWARRRELQRSRLIAAANEKTRRQWETMNRQVVDISHRTAVRITRLINDDIALKERMVQRARNEELVQRGLGNDDAVVPYGFRSQDLESLARAADTVEKQHARIMSRALGLPLLSVYEEDEAPVVETPAEEDEQTRLHSMEEIYRAVAKVEIQAAIRNGKLREAEDAEQPAG